MIEFDQQNKLNQNCINAVRAAIRYVRFSEEFLLEWLVSRKVYANKTTQILSPEAPYTMKNPKFSNTELKTGDLMIIRGKSYVSALIAQIGDEEAQFSHLAIVAEDSSGIKCVVEALIQKGVIVTPLNQWIKEGAVWGRHWSFVKFMIMWLIKTRLVNILNMILQWMILITQESFVQKSSDLHMIWQVMENSWFQNIDPKPKNLLGLIILKN